METFKYIYETIMSAGPARSILFLIFLAYLPAISIYRRVRNYKKEKKALEHGLTIEKASFFAEKAATCESWIVVLAFIGFLFFTFFICICLNNQTGLAIIICIAKLYGFIMAVVCMEMIFWHNKAASYFLQLRNETIPLSLMKKDMATYVTTFMELTKSEDRYHASAGGGGNNIEKANGFIEETERSLLTEVIAETFRDGKMAGPLLPRIEKQLEERKKSAKTAEKMAISGLQDRLGYIMKYNKIPKSFYGRRQKEEGEDKDDC